MINVIMSTEFPNLVDEVKKHGFNVIPSESNKILYDFEKRHADMQCLKIEDTLFVLNECNELKKKLSTFRERIIVTERNIEKIYPNNVLLNSVYINRKLFCYIKGTDTSVLKFCDENDIEIINVSQGYTKCSTAIIDNYFITADVGIYNSMTSNGVKGMLINNGSIQLNGVDYGFIGGCCFCCDDIVYFTGDITKHPEVEKISDFLHKHNKDIVCLSNEKLYDIGGFVIV
ncbi:MAG: DUF6873 family GME fold protein [Ruminococcus sp.]